MVSSAVSRSHARLGAEGPHRRSPGCGNGDKEVPVDGYVAVENKDNARVSSLHYWGCVCMCVCVNDNGVRWADISKAIVAHI